VIWWLIFLFLAFGQAAIMKRNGKEKKRKRKRRSNFPVQSRRSVILYEREAMYAALLPYFALGEPSISTFSGLAELSTEK